MRRAIMVDVDGTVALRPTVPEARGPYDWHRVWEDFPNQTVIDTLIALKKVWHFHRFLVVSGRSDVCQDDTEKWLHRHGVPFDEVFMRKDGDFRADSVVKSEIYRDEIKPYFSVDVVFDDRQSVVEMWRYEHQLTVFQVAEGLF